MKKQPLKGTILLLIASVIWGTAFVAQSMGSNHLNAFAFNGLRNFIGAFTLLPVLIWKLFTTPNESKSICDKIKVLFNKDLLLGGLTCGLSLCVASNFQQMGLETSTVGKSAFITTLYIVFVPLVGLFFKKKLPVRVWVGVILAIIGLYLLCMKDEVFVLSTGDIFLLLSAFFFTIQITAVDYFVPKVDGIALSMMQFLVTAIFSCIGMLFTEIPTMNNVFDAALPLLYTGVISCGIAYTFQIIGQVHLPPTVASLIMSLESVFAALAGWIILKEVLSTKELVGCGLVFTAVILTQLPMPASNIITNTKTPNE